ITVGSRTTLPSQHPLAIVEVNVNKFCIVQGQSIRRGSEMNQIGYVVKDTFSPRFAQAVIVNGIYFLARFGYGEVVLVSELLSRQNHRDANRCEQTDKGKPDLLVLEDHAVILEIVEQTLIAEA